jgi:hypothetical protein
MGGDGDEVFETDMHGGYVCVKIDVIGREMRN